MVELRECFSGVIVGTAVGDAIGLPREGLSRRRASRIFGGAPLRHRLLLGRGMVSDDTEHTCMAAQALLASGGNPHAFTRSMAWRLRWWIVALPAGVGMATAKACVKLWLGFPPSRSGVWSAGNGPAMRTAILGVYAWDDPGLLCQLVHASTRLTHTDPAAEHGALAVALAAAHAMTQKMSGRALDADEYLQLLRSHLSGTTMLRLIEEVVASLAAGMSADQYFGAKGWTRGISGYVNHTVPACLFCWLANPQDFRTAVEQVVIAGGDADSTGAIVGALAAISAGSESIPIEWVRGITEWPRSVAWMEKLASELAADRTSLEKSHRPVPLFWPALLIRNVLFLLLVLVHGLRRLLPPY
jgi:ADP-ribosyl-[dinitrogen reductase] hydrolase